MKKRLIKPSTNKRKLQSQAFRISGSGCGSIGRAVASNTRDPQFESSQRQILFIISCIEMTETKEAGNGPIFNITILVSTVRDETFVCNS